MLIAAVIKMVMVLSCTAAVTVSSLTEVSVRGVGPCASSPFWPSLSSSLLVQKHGSRSRRSSLAVASYGIPSYGAPRPYQTPGADFHNGARPAGTISNPAFGDVTRSGFQWTFGAPHAYGAGVETAELGQQGATLQDVLEDVKEPELDGGDVGSGGRGDDNGGSGGGRGDGSGGGDADKPHKKPGFSMSQKLTLAYAILVGGASPLSHSLPCTPPFHLPPFFSTRTINLHLRILVAFQCTLAKYWRSITSVHWIHEVTDCNREQSIF